MGWKCEGIGEERKRKRGTSWFVWIPLDVKTPKPNPESIEKIIQELNLNKEEAVFVGDSDVDQQTAESSGVRFVAYKNREIANDLFIEDHLDLLVII